MLGMIAALQASHLASLSAVSLVAKAPDRLCQHHCPARLAIQWGILQGTGIIALNRGMQLLWLVPREACVDILSRPDLPHLAHWEMAADWAWPNAQQLALPAGLVQHEGD